MRTRSYAFPVVLRIASIVLWPVLYLLSNIYFVLASFTAIMGYLNSFFDSSDFSLFALEVVSSVPPHMYFIFDLWAKICNSAPSSVRICGRNLRTC